MDVQLNLADELPHLRKMISLFMIFSTFLVVSVVTLIYAHFLLSQMWRRTRKVNIVITKSKLKMSLVSPNVRNYNSAVP